ncbi:HCP-like protein [Myriangium duriaei CBS 260.36]|uniref:HCP-like protein n=1 Tax=Myriangium duriaei CBS 260.36 TaxID=1168546 RepID=A0A9P4MEL7_9PEZI|nr:HCP-like protein [Myriangium duriaei CBS 260.36]
MTLRDLLRKKHEIDRRNKLQAEHGANHKSTKSNDSEKLPAPPAAEFTFLRTTTLDQEEISLPSFPSDEDLPQKSPPHNLNEKVKKRRSLFRRTSADQHADTLGPDPSTPPKPERKLSQRLSSLRLRSGSRSDSYSSVVPDALSAAPEPVAAPQSPQIKRNASNRSVQSTDSATERAREKAWEKRATQLAMLPPVSSTSSTSSSTTSPRTPAQQADDEAKLQRAITLHESGELEDATKLFGELARPSAANSPLAQVLYGLALRHGWGIAIDTPAALQFFSLAAAGAAKQPAAKAELILALFELGNSYRHGWGCAVDPRAARAYYDAAANLGYSDKASSLDAGDADALEEAAWCWLTGFGGEKDKRRAAGYLRRAEQLGRKQVGQSWIWKGKYDPPTSAAA